MRYYETKTKEVRIRVKIECDFCGQDAEAEEQQTGHHVGGQLFYSEETNVNLWCSTNYPDGGGEGERWELDVCPKCFVEKIVPMALEARRKPEASSW